MSEVTRARISAARMGQVPWNKGTGKAVFECVCLQCGQEFPSYNQQAKYCGHDCYHAAQKEHGMPEVTRLAVRKANLGSHRSQEAREKTAAKLRGRTHPGHPVSEKTRRAISLAKQAYWTIPGNREKMSAGETGFLNHAWGKPSWSKGISVPDVVKTKISEALKVWAAIPENRKTLSRPGQKGALSPRYNGGPQVSNARAHSKRRSLGHVHLNPWFAGCDGHHVDNDQVIHLPHWMHQGKGLSHNHYTGRGIAKINAIAYNFLFKQEVEAAMRKAIV
jgi:hypothetical protein